MEGGFQSYGPLLATITEQNQVFAVNPYGEYIKDVEELSIAFEACAEAIADIAGERRLLLVGYSFGGIWATEVARRLEARGCEKVSLVLIDSTVPNLAWEEPSPASFARFILEGKIDSFSEQISADDEFFDRLQICLVEQNIATNFNTPVLRKMFRLYEKNMRFIGKGNFSPCDVGAMFFASKVLDGPKVGESIRWAWPNATITRINADHNSIMRRPSIELVAKGIQQMLRM